MSSEMITSPIIQTTPGSTRIFRNNNFHEDNTYSIETTSSRKIKETAAIFVALVAVSEMQNPLLEDFSSIFRITLFCLSRKYSTLCIFPINYYCSNLFYYILQLSILVYFSNTKPLYYEDLFIDTDSLPLLKLDDKIRKKFENTFEITLVTTNALLLGALSDYWIYRTEEKHAMIEVIGITGGILKIFQFNVNNVIGSFILYIISLKIRKEHHNK